MSEELNPNWFEVTIPCTLPLTFAEWNDQREHYFEILRSKISRLIKELKSEGLISLWHFLKHKGIDLRLLLRDPREVSKVEELLKKHGLDDNLKTWPREKSKFDEDRILELLSEATLVLIDHHDLTNFLFREGPIHYISNQLGIGNFAEAELYLRLSRVWFFTFLSKNNMSDKAQLVNEAFEQFQKSLLVRMR